MNCPTCGNDAPAGSAFCNGCGGTLGAAPASAARERQPRDYTPKHLADKILQSRSALEGERKQVTVMFADVKGSMELAEQLDPEDWTRIMQRFFKVLSEGVERFEGFVDKFTGDGIMALFGAPIAHEDHAQRACYAALHLRDEIARYATDVKRKYGVGFSTRMGLNSGEVVVGKIGDDLRMNYTAQGHTVGLAQRMEALAESGHICLSEHTARLVEGYFQLKDLGRTKVKGVSDPVGLFDLEGVGAFRTRLDRSHARGLSRFVGRDGDTAILEAALQRAKSGGGQVVGVVAEAGTGKSRLCAEYLDTCRARGVPVYEGRGVAHGKSIPMLPMLELWRAFYGITERDDPESVRAKIAGRLLLMDDAFREVLPYLFELFGVPDPANPAPAIDPEQRQKRIHGVVKRVLHDPAFTGQTRVFLLEDLHWFDGASDDFLETTVDSMPATRDLLLVNFRPEYQARWMQRSYYQHLALQPFGPEAIRALLRDHLGDDPSVTALPESIHARTKGNPFFIEEVVQSLVENGHLTGSRGAYKLTTPIAALEVPPTVQAVLAARIDRLPEREKLVLQTAAIVGKTFTEEILRKAIASVSKIDGTALSQSLSALAAAEFLFEAALYPQLEYSFKHPLTQEVAQGSQLRERRAKVHAAVAHALEEAGGNLDERAAEIAQHRAEAGEAARAARWYRRAAQWAGLSSLREVLQHWRRVRELAPSVEDEPERIDLSLQACEQILSFAWRTGGTEEEAAAVFEEGRALAERKGDHQAQALLIGRYAYIRMSVAGSAADHVRYGEEAARIAEKFGDPALRAAIWCFPAIGHMIAGDGNAALAWSARILREVGSDNLLGREIAGFSPRVGVHLVRAWALTCLGRMEEASAQFIEAHRIVEEAQELEMTGWLLNLWMLFDHAYGASASHLERGHRALEIAEALDNEGGRSTAYKVLGLGYLLGGQALDAREALRNSITISQEHRAEGSWLPSTLAALSEAQLALGERDDALESAREAIRLGNAGGCRFFEAQAQLALSAVLLATDGALPRAEIESALARAEHLVESIAARALSPRILEKRGRLAAALGDAATSGRLLREALDLYRSIGAMGHAARLKREIG